MTTKTGMAAPVWRVYKVDGTVETLGHVDPDLKVMQNVVGGYIEMVPRSFFTMPPIEAYCNEDGIAMKLAPNIHAMEVFGWYSNHPLRGDLLVREPEFDRARFEAQR